MEIITELGIIFLGIFIITICIPLIIGCLVATMLDLHGIKYVCTVFGILIGFLLVEFVLWWVI